MISNLDEHFSEVFGQRWNETLKPALLQAVQKVHIKSPFGSDCTGPSFESTKLIYGDSPESSSYSLDKASIYPVLELDPQPGESYLDLCAAPGGKSLMALFLTEGQLHAHLNDLSKDRAQRLKAVLHDYLPESLMKELKITAWDGSRFGMNFKESFDRVLADVPCSAERHHLQDGDTESWTLKSTKRMAVRQHALLCSAVDCASPGGRIVYSTCSLSEFENDGVIRKLLKSRRDQVQVQPTRFDVGEPTEFGRLILPDRGGSGPIYYSVLEKT